MLKLVGLVGNDVSSKQFILRYFLDLGFKQLILTQEELHQKHSYLKYVSTSVIIPDVVSVHHRNFLLNNRGSLIILNYGRKVEFKHFK